MTNIDDKRRELRMAADDLVKSIRKRERDKSIVYFMAIGAVGAFYYLAPSQISGDAMAIVITLIVGFSLVICELLEIQARILGSQLGRVSDALDNLPEPPDRW